MDRINDSDLIDLIAERDILKNQRDILISAIRDLVKAHDLFMVAGGREDCRFAAYEALDDARDAARLILSRLHSGSPLAGTGILTPGLGEKGASDGR